MEKYQNLLLIVSPDMQRTPAFTRARELARKSGARLHLCLVDYSTAIANLRHIDQSVMRLAADNYMNLRLRWLQDQTAALASEGVQADCSAVWAKAADRAIIAAVLERKPDLVIKDEQAATPVLRNVFTPLDWQLLRLCPAPLMLVSAQSGAQLKRIIATVDPMEDSDSPHELNDRILRAAQALAWQCDAQLHAVYAYPHLNIPPDAVERTKPTYYSKMHEEARATHHKAFDRLLDRYALPADHRHFLEHQEVETAISEFANRSDTDLLVLGTVYRSSIDRLMLGSTAERLLYRVNCDVLALKPKGFGEQLPQWLKTEPGIVYQAGKN
jgi:universal stress protein E